ncbi:MAG TPA: tol-pal system-associated acyl-CoA thioesterase [Gammaproteobacteria bacterium]|nr:tol-pal system-associated acyl-CoA thioesterase [Gammaproteobacteria bacterium]
MKKTKEFNWPVRVYYEDTDSGGVVYYANYLKFMERARTELLRHLGFEQDQLQQERGILFAVHSASVKYKKPARFNDELTVVTSIPALGKASITFQQNVVKDDVVLVQGQIKIACLNAEKFAPQTIPAGILDSLQQEFDCGS